MSGPQRIIVDISANGYGHLAQLAPILQNLNKQHPGSSFILRTELDPSICAEFLSIQFELGPKPPDPDMRMRGPLHVDTDGLFSDYVQIFADRRSIIENDAQTLKSLSPDFMITNISVASIAAAKAADVPVVAVSSLNWADVFQSYCGDREGAQEIYQWMIESYSQADLFLLLTPHLPMSWLPNPVSINSIARTGTDRRDALTKLRPADYYVLASMGGIPGIHSELSLPVIDGVVWVTPPEWRLQRDDVISRAGLEIPFINLMRSTDAIVTKAGYGSVTEAAANGTRILYTERDNWCETPILEAWMDTHCTAQKLTRESFNSGEFTKILQNLLSTPDPIPIATNGAEEAVIAITTLL
jgi:hypothetical protein